MIEGTGLQVLEASQGGLHPAVGVRCYSLFLFSHFEAFACFKVWFFYFKVLTLVSFKFFFDFRLILIIDLIGFLLILVLLSEFHGF